MDWATVYSMLGVPKSLSFAFSAYFDYWFEIAVYELQFCLGTYLLNGIIFDEGISIMLMNFAEVVSNSLNGVFGVFSIVIPASTTKQIC